jgi:hypothetical protein
MELGYQSEAAPVRGLLIFIILVVVTAVALHLLIWWLMKGYEAHDARAEPPLSVLREDQTPPPPRLQPSVGHDTMDYQDLAAVRHRENEMFTKLGWAVPPGAKDAEIPPDIVQQVANEQRTRAAAAFVPPTTTGRNTNSIIPATIPANDTHSGTDGGPR